MLHQNVQWEFNQELQNILPCHVPTECPYDRQYVPPRMSAKLITWAHTSSTSSTSGHLSTHRTRDVVGTKYRMPFMIKGVHDFVKLCAISAQTMVPFVPKPLPNPQRPWSHLTVDFLTDSPTQKCMTMVHVFIFS